MIQHDCGHQTLFSQSWLNNWVGRMLGVLTLTPYDYWQRNHALHHAGSGNLDYRGVGDIDTLTVDEFLALSKFKQFMYRAYRHPITLFFVGPAFVFLFQHRLPMRMMKHGWTPWLSTMCTNLAIVIVSAIAIWITSFSAFLLVVLPTTLLAASTGVFLFFVQHQFEETMWDQPPHWDRHEAALFGSSHYDLPPVLRWLTGNIGVHHVHHLNSRIPFFKLANILKENPELVNINRITLRESFSMIKLALWDKENRKLVSFAHALNQA